jgi:hypothetical protein
MEKKQSESRRTVRTEKSKKTSTILKRDKHIIKKPVKKVALKGSLENSDASTTETTGSDNKEIQDIAGFIVNWFPISLLILLLFLSPVFLFSMWFFGLFLDDFDSNFNLTTGLFGILGGVTGWRWKKKKSWVAVCIGLIIGIAIPFGYLLLLTNFISY